MNVGQKSKDLPAFIQAQPRGLLHSFRLTAAMASLQKIKRPNWSPESSLSNADEKYFVVFKPLNYQIPTTMQLRLTELQGDYYQYNGVELEFKSAIHHRF